MFLARAALTDMPITEISPRAAGTKPIIALNSVDLPAPFTPTNAVIVPAGISKLVSDKAVCPLR